MSVRRKSLLVAVLALLIALSVTGVALAGGNARKGSETRLPLGSRPLRRSRYPPPKRTSSCTSWRKRSWPAMSTARSTRNGARGVLQDQHL